MTKWLFWFGAPVKERSATSSVLGKNKIGIVAKKLNSMKNFKDYVTNPVHVRAFFFQNRVLSKEHISGHIYYTYAMVKHACT